MTVRNCPFSANQYGTFQRCVNIYCMFYKERAGGCLIASALKKYLGQEDEE